MAAKPDPETVTHWIDGLKDRDQDALRKLWDRYSEKVIRVARQRLRGMRLAEVDEEDVALEVFESLYYDLAQGRFPKLENRDDLWQILLVLTARRAINTRQRVKAQKRGGGMVRGDSVFSGPAGSESQAGGFDRVADPQPEPGLIAQVSEQCQNLIDHLPDESLKQMAHWRLEGYSVEEIAGEDKLNCSTRSVERRLKQIREIWSKLLEVDIPL